MLERNQHPVSRKSFSRQALTVLEGLRRAGYQAYLVGGCIRDMLTGKSPKDFDVSTNATPEQVRRVFQNSRIIGRRFKIVHVVFGREIIEVTTFRSGADISRPGIRVSDNAGMLVRDNVYGKSLEEDADRRDFTINAIYYNIKNYQLIDFHGGLYDLQHGIIDIIGDPETRYLEDPVRIIRALRFAAKLGFKISKRTSAPIRALAENLKQVSNARMYEEVNKLFLSGHGLQSYRILRNYKIFEILFPGIDEYYDNPMFNSFVEFALKSSDDRFAENKRNMPHFLYAIILWFSFQKEVFNLQQVNESLVDSMSLRDILEIAFDKVMSRQNPMTAIPLSITESIRSMWTLQFMLTDKNQEHTAAIAGRTLFRGGFDIFRIRARFEPYLRQFVDFWQPFYDESSAQARDRAQKQELFEQTRTLGKRDKKIVVKEVFGDDDAKEKNDRLARARAWRAAMHLDP